jgi:hypothetical protein
LCSAVADRAHRTGRSGRLDVRAAAAYERYMTGIEQAFAGLTGSDTFLQQASPQTLTRLRGGEIVAGPGQGDGIMDVPNGLIHHWRAAVFVPNVRLADVLEMVRDYSDYYSVYDWMIASALISREGDRYRSFFRLKRSVGVVTGVLDLWTVTEYRYLRADRRWLCRMPNAATGGPPRRRERRLRLAPATDISCERASSIPGVTAAPWNWTRLLSRDFTATRLIISRLLAGWDATARLSLNGLPALRCREGSMRRSVVSGRTWCGE